MTDNEVIDTGQQLDMFGGTHPIETIGKGKPTIISMDDLLKQNDWKAQ